MTKWGMKVLYGNDNQVPYYLELSIERAKLTPYFAQKIPVLRNLEFLMLSKITSNVIAY